MPPVACMACQAAAGPSSCAWAPVLECPAGVLRCQECHGRTLVQEKQSSPHLNSYLSSHVAHRARAETRSARSNGQDCWEADSKGQVGAASQGQHTQAFHSIYRAGPRSSWCVGPRGAQCAQQGANLAPAHTLSLQVGVLGQHTSTQTAWAPPPCTKSQMARLHHFCLCNSFAAA